MTQQLKEIKTRYPGQCATCGREIKEGWNIFFEPSSKKTYCKPCVQKMPGQEQNEIPNDEIPDDILAEIEGVSPALRAVLIKKGVIKTHSVDERLDAIEANTSLAVTVLAEIHDSVNLMRGVLALMTKPEKPAATSFVDEDKKKK